MDTGSPFFAHLDNADLIRTHCITTWQPDIDVPLQALLRQDLECGAVVHLPTLKFPLGTHELAFIDPHWSNGESKNIVLRPGATTVRGAAGTAEEQAVLQQLLSRYAQASRALVHSLFPAYIPHLAAGNTSLRPHEIAGRKSGWRKDDTRLHVDAFPSAPSNGKRLLRVFHNVNASAARVWRIGEAPFADFAEEFLPRTRSMWPGQAWLLQQLRITKRRRSEYDNRMLQLHDLAKRDLRFQASTGYQEHHFASGATWLVFSDQALHSVQRGQGLLEQTFYLAPEAVKDQTHAPPAVLARLLHQRLI